LQIFKHKHHIIPKHMGGTNDPSNLIRLTIEEHAEAHRKLWETFGKKEDYIAWKALSGSISCEEITRLILSMVGQRQGKINAENGHMSNIGKNMPMEDRLRYSALAVEVMRSEKLGCFFNDELRRKSCSLGGKIQGPRNVKSGHLSRIAKIKTPKREQAWKEVQKKSYLVCTPEWKSNMLTQYWADVHSGLKQRVKQPKKITINNGINNKQILAIETIPEGWKRGILRSRSGPKVGSKHKIKIKT